MLHNAITFGEDFLDHVVIELVFIAFEFGATNDAFIGNNGSNAELTGFYFA